jgi:hypothetical protein
LLSSRFTDFAQNLHISARPIIPSHTECPLEFRRMLPSVFRLSSFQKARKRLSKRRIEVK